jgi:hypothetical protein
MKKSLIPSLLKSIGDFGFAIIMRAVILVSVFLMVVASCSKDKDSKSSGVLIKGSISGNSQKEAGFKSASSLSLADAKKVFVVNITNGQLMSKFIDIVDGSFTDTTELGIATALVFLDADNKYIGTLSSRGLNLLPLNNLTDGNNTTINLADLTMVGNSIVPSHDPLGDEIIITNDEVDRLKEIDGFFESLSKNIDADNDNILDVLNDKQLFIKTRFWFRASHWGLNDSPPLLADVDTVRSDYTIELDGASGFSLPNNIVLSGPVDEPYNDIATQFINGNGNDGFYAGISRKGGLFKRGTYTVKIDGNNYTLDYSNTDCRQNLLFVLPTLHTNSQGQVVSISLEYKLPDGTSIDPVNIITDIMVQFSDDSGNQYYNSPWLKNANAGIEHCTCVSGLFTYTPDVPVDISNLVKITIPYNDLLGNTYFIEWNK